MEAGAHAGDGIVTRYVISADRPDHVTGRQRERRSSWFACAEKIGSLRGQGQQFGEVGPGKVMQKQIRDDRVYRAVPIFKEIENIRGNYFDFPSKPKKLFLRLHAHNILLVQEDQFYISPFWS